MHRLPLLDGTDKDGIRQTTPPWAGSNMCQSGEFEFSA